MKLINKNAKVIRQHEKFARFSPFIRFSTEKYVHFPVSTVELADLRIGSYVHFIELDKTTLFFTNADDNGYKLIANGPRDSALRICSAAFLDWFRTKYRIANNKSISFYVIESQSEYQGHKLFEILTDTPRVENKKFWWDRF